MKQLLLFASLLFFLTPNAHAGIVSGTLTYSTTSGPVGGQKVYLVDTSSSTSTVLYRDSAITNTSGAYSITIPGTVTTGQVYIYAPACGFPWSSGHYSYSGSNLTINLVIFCSPPVVFDTVKNSTTGVPIFGQKVYLLDSTATNYYLDSAYTDLTGTAHFVLPSTVLPGTLRVYTYACGLQSQSFTYSGSTLFAPTLLVCASNATVSGTVTNVSTSTAVAGHKVVVVDSSATAALYKDSVFTNSSGGYSIMIPAYLASGTMIAAVQACGIRHTASNAYTGGSLTLNLSVCATSTATISGTVTDAASAPVSGRKVYLADSSLSTASIVYRDSTTTNASGGYSFTIPASVSSGYFQLGVPSCAGILSGQSRNYTGTSLIVNFTVCGSSTTPATFSGTITTGPSSLPFAGVTVYLDPPAGSGASRIYTTTNSSGYYSISIPITWPAGIVTWGDSTGCGQHIYTQFYSGVNITLNDFICPYTLSGTVSKQGAGVASAAKVYLIFRRRDTTTTPATVTLQAIDSTVTNSSGQYTIYPNLPSWPLGWNNYLHIKAALQPFDPAYTSYLPTYRDSSLLWSGADSLTTWNGSNLNISLRGGVNPGGAAFIGGDVLLGANKSAGVGDPLSGRIILLTTAADVAVRYTYSDAAGKFSFTNLPYGTYKLFGDAWGKTNPPLTVTVSLAKPSVSNVKFEENSTTFKGSVDALSVPNAVGTQIALYPNPARDVLRLTGVQGAVSVTLRNVMGVVVRQMASANGESVSLYIADLPAGVYNAQILAGKAVSRQTIVKQ